MAKQSASEFEAAHKICCGKYHVLTVLKIVAGLDFTLWLALLLYAFLEANSEQHQAWRIGVEFFLVGVLMVAIILLLVAVYVKKHALMMPRIVLQIIIMLITAGYSCFLLYNILFVGKSEPKSERRKEAASLMNKVGLGFLLFLLATQCYVLYLLYAGYRYLKARADFIAVNTVDPDAAGRAQPAHNPAQGPPPDYKA